jgi:hypothetical protein
MSVIDVPIKVTGYLVGHHSEFVLVGECVKVVISTLYFILVIVLITTLAVIASIV